MQLIRQSFAAVWTHWDALASKTHHSLHLCVSKVSSEPLVFRFHYFITMSLLLKCQRASAHSYVQNVKPATYLHCFLVQQPHTSVFLSIISGIGMLSQKQPPHPTLMRYFPVSSLSGTHQDALAFTLHYKTYMVKCIQDHLGKWWLFTLVFSGGCLHLVVVYTYI